MIGREGKRQRERESYLLGLERALDLCV